MWKGELPGAAGGRAPAPDHRIHRHFIQPTHDHSGGGSLRHSSSGACGRESCQALWGGGHPRRHIQSTLLIETQSSLKQHMTTQGADRASDRESCQALWGAVCLCCCWCCRAAELLDVLCCCCWFCSRRCWCCCVAMLLLQLLLLLLLLLQLLPSAALQLLGSKDFLCWGFVG